MSALHLYSYASCPFAQRTRITLAEKNLDFERTEIELGNKPDWFLKVSPYGKVPCLQHGDRVLYESAIINEYLNEVFPEIPLMPSDPYLCAQARIWLHYADNYYSSASWAISTSHHEPEKQKTEMAKLEDCFRFMESEGLGKFSGEGPFWFGDQLSLVDIQFLPWMERFPAYTALWGITVPDECARVKSWMASLQDTKGWAETSRPVSDHVEGLKKRIKMVA